MKLLLSVYTCYLVTLAASAFQPNQPMLIWEAANSDAEWVFPNETGVERARPIIVFSEFFELAASSRWHLDSWPDVLELELFHDALVRVILEHSYETKTGTLILVGKVDGDPLGSFHAAIQQNIIAMDISVASRLFQVRYVNSNLHQVLEINQSLFPADEEPTEVFLPGPVSPALPPAAAGSGNTQIDVMVVYTETAKNQQGGQAAIEALVDLAIAITNTSYQNSSVEINLNLVHQQEIVYTETSNMATDRNRLQNPSDGFMDDVHALRLQYGADMVALVRGSLGGSCGIAYIMNPVTPDFRDFGFCVVSRTCISGNYSFGHELGHIMSARHDWFADGTSNAPFPYNHGYVNTGSQWRTVMSYNNLCANQGFSCTRINYWSNPEVLFNGEAMGIPEGQSQPSFNAKALNTTATTVAAFMETINCEDDVYEPNNAIAPDQILTGTVAGTTYPNLQVCPGDRDVFTVDLAAWHILEVRISFIHADGDLQLKLYNQAGELVSEINTSQNFETLTTAVGDTPQRFYVEVAGVSGASNAYDLQIKDEPEETRYFDYWMSETLTMCSDNTPTIQNLICYLNNGFECPPNPCN